MSPRTHRFLGTFAFQGVHMLPREDIEPVTAAQAAERLGRASATIRSWAVRYGARQLRKVGKRVYYDMRDLRVIEREILHGHPVSATWQERAAIRLLCPLRETERALAAA